MLQADVAPSVGSSPNHPASGKNTSAQACDACRRSPPPCWRRVRRFARHQVSGHIARRHAAHAQHRQQQMGEVLAHAGAGREHVLESTNARAWRPSHSGSAGGWPPPPRGRSRPACRRLRAPPSHQLPQSRGCAGRSRWGRASPSARRTPRRDRPASASRTPPSGMRARLVHQHDRVGFHAQVAMLGEHVEAMHPIAQRIHVAGGPRPGMRLQAERNAGLPLVLARAQPHLVVALRDRTVVLKFRHVQNAVSVHATTE